MQVGGLSLWGVALDALATQRFGKAVEVHRRIPGGNDRIKTMTDVPEFFQREVLDKSREKPVLVDFWAPWCGPCHMLSPTLEKLARENGGAWRLVKINADRQPGLSARYGVRGIPSVKMFMDGEVSAEFTGALPEQAVRQWLRAHLPVRDAS